jgi:hypothetical protein
MTWLFQSLQGCRELWVSSHGYLPSLNTHAASSFAMEASIRSTLAVPGELLFRVTSGHVTLLRAKRPADAPLCPLNVADFKGIRTG